jgi:hypothetical protein
MSDTQPDEKRKRGWNLPKGRAVGVPNKVNREIRAIAADYGPEALRRLAVLGGLIPASKLRAGEAPAKSEATQAVCLSHILNRAYGFPSQPLQHSADESFESLLDRLERRRLGQPEPLPAIELQITQDGSFEAIEPSASLKDPEEPPDSHHKPHSHQCPVECPQTGFERPLRG